MNACGTVSSRLVVDVNKNQHLDPRGWKTVPPEPGDEAALVVVAAAHQ
jgi:hypothetical protein